MVFAHVAIGESGTHNVKNSRMGKEKQWNLKCQTVEGLEVENIPAVSIQYHPEPVPGPHDACAAFQRFKEIVSRKDAKTQS